MNLPNKLTVSRLVLAPIFFICFHLPIWFGEAFSTASAILMVAVFLCIELTDLLDGIIARKRNMVTDLGKVMDPFADTFSRLTYFVCFTVSSVMPSWVFIIIMWREFGILFVRMLMMGKGKAVAANIWGKSKAVLYAVSAALGILYVSFSRVMGDASWLSTVKPIVTGVFILAAIASVGSFLIYVRDIIKSGSLSSMSR